MKIKIKAVVGVMVARVRKANAAVLEYRRVEYLKKHTLCKTLSRPKKEQEHLAKRTKTRRDGMENPLFDVYTLIPVGWKKRPRSKPQADEWSTAIRLGILPEKALVFTKQGSEQLIIGDRVGILFFE